MKFEKRSVRIRVNVRDEVRVKVRVRVKDRVGVRFYYIFEKLFFT